eukprot:XP_001700435.1 predicted protein [Chlamydomonas reinhardtii]
MGLDGGTIATRSDVLRRQSSRVAQNDTSRSSRGGNAAGKVSDPGAVEASVARQTAWSNCALSSQPLQPPLVADGLGRLYNKEAVLQFILCARDKVSEPEALLQYANQLRVAAGGLDHITSLRDVFDVTLTAAERDRATQAGGASSSSGGGGRARGAGSEAVYTSTVPINGTSEQVVVLRAALKAAAAAKAAKRELAATGAAGEEAGRGGSKKRRKGESGEAA